MSSTPALHSAVRGMDLGKVKTLVESGVDVNMRDSYQKTALHLFNCKYYSVVQHEMLCFLLDHGTSVTAYPETFRSVAANIFREGEVYLVKILFEYGIDLSAKENDGSTLLHHAAFNRNPGVIELFQGKAVDVNVCDKHGYTPIWNAAKVANIDAVKFLLENGADVTAGQKSGYTLFSWGYRARCFKRESRDDWLQCSELLISHGADCEVVDFNGASRTIFDWTVRSDSYVLIEPVLAHLAMKEARGKPINGDTRLHMSFYQKIQDDYNLCRRTIRDMKSQVFMHRVTLFDLSEESDEKISRIAQNQHAAERLEKIMRSEQLTDSHVRKNFRKRIEKALRIAKSREQCADIIAEFTILGRNLDVVKIIVQLLSDEDLENVCEQSETISDIFLLFC